MLKIGMMTYDGLETCINKNNNLSLQEESGRSRGDECLTDSLGDDAFSSCSSSKDTSESFSSKWLPKKNGKHISNEWDYERSPKHFYSKEERPGYTLCSSDVEAMKEKFSKLLLGGDLTGGRKGVPTALALSNSISHLGNSVFGELWKLEPLSEDNKQRWRREMDWLLSPCNHMIELVPSKLDDKNGRSLEIMTPKPRANIHMNLPALRKLDSMLIETLDSMVCTEFWYSEVGRRAEGKNEISRESRRWWLPSPKVPKPGLSSLVRKNLLEKGNVVYQSFKAAKSINEQVLLEMPVPTIIKDSLPKSGKTSLGDELFRMLSSESASVDKIFVSLRLRTEHAALETVNRLEPAIYAWKEKIIEETSSGKWSLVRDSLSEISRIESLINKAERLNGQIKSKYSNLPQTFLDATKIQYGKDIGHAILEAYSRILASLAFRILSRIREILQEDALSNSGSPATPRCFSGSNDMFRTPERLLVSSRLRHSLIHDINKADDGTRKSRLSTDS
ncbi:PREDICTED: rop guanine nucleotide exchange factor 14-like isoform X1 [Brassica oleracea var. oleracea]|uniref:PRONE domain-containing protein n=1 Tax=Brassica oleracea var. oleracea TaxID=109376 RepID=A0A0D3BRR4_BRAOL|nr:PREDICTED: rop guanine nucleotide exchange factor 14-like isoform X1 [Brassica oleracea var. oleracea]